MDQQAAHELRACLARDETLLWAGRPDPWRYAVFETGWRLFVAVPFTLFVLGAMLSVALGYGDWSQAGLIRFALVLFSLPFLYVGFGFILAPVERYREARHVAYGLTDRRAITLVGGTATRIEEVPCARFDTISTEEHSDDRATVLFYEVARRSPGSEATGYARRGFVGVRDAQRLAAALERLKADAG